MEFKIAKEVKLNDHIFDARYHPETEKDLVAASTIGGDVYIIDDGIIKTHIKRHHKGSSIRKVRFTRNGLMATIAKTAKIYDLESGQVVTTLKRDDQKKTAFYSLRTFGNDFISAGDDDGCLFLWDTRTPEEPIFKSQDCEQYISDIDGKYETRKLIVCSSGEGTLTAYDMRTKKMIEPQSELFEAGFQCLKMVDSSKKIIIGGEDGAVYIFNQNEWAHTSGKFAIDDDARNRGRCSIDCLDILHDGSTFLAGGSDGKLRAFTLNPQQVIGVSSLCKKSSLESVHVKPGHDSTRIVVSGDNYINLVEFTEKEEDGSESHDSDSDSSNGQSSESESESAQPTDDENTPTADEQHESKKFKSDTEDYLNIFGK